MARLKRTHSTMRSSDAPSAPQPLASFTNVEDLSTTETTKRRKTGFTFSAAAHAYHSEFGQLLLPHVDNSDTVALMILSFADSSELLRNSPLRQTISNAVKKSQKEVYTQMRTLKAEYLSKMRSLEDEFKAKVSTAQRNADLSKEWISKRKAANDGFVALHCSVCLLLESETSVRNCENCALVSVCAQCGFHCPGVDCPVAYCADCARRRVAKKSCGEKLCFDCGYYHYKYCRCDEGEKCYRSHCDEHCKNIFTLPRDRTR